MGPSVALIVQSMRSFVERNKTCSFNYGMDLRGRPATSMSEKPILRVRVAHLGASACPVAHANDVNSARSHYSTAEPISQMRNEKMTLDIVGARQRRHPPPSINDHRGYVP